MTIKKWDPFRNLVEISDDLDRILEHDLNHRIRDSHPYSSVWIPAVDMCETENEIVVHAELPGIDKDDLSVEVEDDHLIITGERRFERGVHEENYHQIERSYGEFYRALRLPAPIDVEQIQANYNNGLLTVLLPKTESARPKTIEIKGE